MQSTNLTRAVLGTLAEAYPQAMQVPRLAEEVHCELDALYKHLWLLHDVGVIRANAQGEVVEAASITDAGLSFVRHEAESHAGRSRFAIHH